MQHPLLNTDFYNIPVINVIENIEGEVYRGIAVEYFHADDTKFYAFTKTAPWFCLSENQLDKVKEKAYKAIDSYRDYEEKDWVKR